MESQITGGATRVRSGLPARLISFVISIGACFSLLGCVAFGDEIPLQDGGEIRAEEEGDEPIFRLTDEELPEDSGALRSLSVSLEIPDEDSRLLVWWIRQENDDPAGEAAAFAPVRYGRKPQGFQTLTGPEPLQPCSSYGVTLVFVQGATRIEFETPCD